MLKKGDQVALFDLCASMLDSLRDGHVNLYSAFDRSYNTAWYDTLPVNFNSSLQALYLKNYRTAGSLYYCTIDNDSVGYIYYTSFSNSFGASNLAWVFKAFKDCKGLIIDLRNNGGGEITNATLTLSNNINELDRLEPFLEEFFQQNGLALELLSKIDLALEEALANVIMYAYPKGTEGDVTLSMKVEDNAIHMEISDRGVPFNPLQQQEADLDVPLDERKIGGWGIHLIKEIMDSVVYEYHEGRNVLKLFFYYRN